MVPLQLITLNPSVLLWRIPWSLNREFYTFTPLFPPPWGPSPSGPLLLPRQYVVSRPGTTSSLSYWRWTPDGTTRTGVNSECLLEIPPMKMSEVSCLYPFFGSLHWRSGFSVSPTHHKEEVNTPKPFKKRGIVRQSGPHSLSRPPC